MSLFWEPTARGSLSSRRESWGELNDLDETTPGNEDHRYLTRALGGKQWWFTAGLVVIGLVGLLGRAMQLQMRDGRIYRALADGNRIRSTMVLAPRGLIVDRYGQPLTENIPRLSLAVLPREVPADPVERAAFFEALAPIAQVSAADIEQAWQPAHARNTAAPVVIKNDIALDQGPALTVAVSRWPSIQVLTTPERTYPLTATGVASLSHVLGYVGRVSDKDLAANDHLTSQDIIGKSGLELQYDALLRGQNGQRDVEVDALGREQQLVTEQPSVPGETLRLTIDADLQRVTETALREALGRVQATGGTVIAMDPTNGEVLALVSLPSFDANAFAHGLTTQQYQAIATDPAQPLFNRVVQGQYPSGSTIKPVYAAAALAEGIITNQTKMLSTGGLHVGRFFFPDWKTGGHGVTDVRKAIAESVNTFFYTIGGGYGDQPGLGIERMGTYLKRFGLGVPTGIDLPGEASGLVPTPEWKEKVKQEPWYIGDTYHVAIGQGDLLVTPLQVAGYLMAFANGGTLYEPRLMLSHKASSDNRTPAVMPSKVIRTELVSGQTMQIVREGMRETVVSGSARSLAQVAVPVAGKTGTAQPGGSKRPYAWFIGFAPYDSPRIAVTVMLEDAGEGSSFAVPVARAMLEWWASHRQ